MPPKGKQATKGQKQIVEENKGTIQFYLYLILGVNGTYFFLQYIFFWDDFTWVNWTLCSFATLVYFACHQFMVSMAKATYGATGQLVDGGVDLNMESGMAEHLKDLIILTGIVQLLTLISNYFWLIWLLAPGRALYMLWVNILSPWIFAEAPEVDEKKQKKMERKMRRSQMS